VRIGIIHPEIRFRGGAENLTLWLAAGLQGRGHQVTVFAAGLDTRQWPELDLSGIDFVDLPDHSTKFWHQPRRSRKHGRIIAAKAPQLDLLMAGNYPSYLWLADALPGLSPRPATLMFCQEPYRNHYYVETDWPTIDYVNSGRKTLPFHDVLARHVRYREGKHRFGKRPLARWYDRRRLKHVDHILANSEFSSRNASKAFQRPVEALLLGAPDPHTEGGPPSMEGREGVLVLMGWHRAKNPEAILGAALQLKSMGRQDIRFTVSGRIIDAEQQSFVHEHGIADLIRLVGFVSEEEKHRLLASARLCLFVPWAEPFGLVPVEAMLHGTPVVAAHIGGPAEVVADGETGVLVDESDPEAIAKAIVDLYDDLPRLESMSRAARLRAEQHFSLAGFIDRFEAKAVELVDRFGPNQG
jgi:glycosyltransferase involved in cell wall biosynthesis